jgi:putative aldouronate transport system substrate-binding protein
LDYKKNYLTQYLEKLHNINLDFYALPTEAGEVKTKVSLLVAANDLPDTLLTSALTEEQLLDYGSNGAFIKLNNYVNDPAKAPYFTAIPAEDRNFMLTAMTMADGNIYGLAKSTPETWNLTGNRIYINRAWLTKLGLKEPSTTDELRNVLLAFRDRDPNGNGNKDEIGILGMYNEQGAGFGLQGA